MAEKICIITGPCASGKSTIARTLAEEIKKSVYIDVDNIREMIKNGYANPFTYKGESKKQIQLGIKNTCQIANNFLKAGFNVFIDDVLEREGEIKIYEKFLNKKPTIFLLLPCKKILKKRDKQRNKNQQMGKRALELHDILSKVKEKREWYILDTTNQTINQTKKEILKLLK